MDDIIFFYLQKYRSSTFLALTCRFYNSFVFLYCNFCYYVFLAFCGFYFLCKSSLHLRYPLFVQTCFLQVVQMELRTCTSKYKIRYFVPMFIACKYFVIVSELVSVSVPITVCVYLSLYVFYLCICLFLSLLLSFLSIHLSTNICTCVHTRACMH